VTEAEELTQRVREALADETDVVEKRMFGSIGFMVGGVLRVGVGRHPDHVMMLRCSPDDAARLAGPGVHPAVMRGRTMRGWLFLDEPAIASDDHLVRWVAAALAAPT
jgi:TfoX/Sxy family transcriptional regulator of competence genes